MKTIFSDQAPYPLMEAVGDNGGLTGLFRKVWLNRERTEFVLYDLSQDEKSLSHFFTRDPNERQSSNGRLQEIPERISSERMKVCRRWEVLNKTTCEELYRKDPASLPEACDVLDLTTGNWESWRRSWRFVHCLFTGNDVVFGRPLRDVFLDDAWRQQVFKLLAETQGTRPDRVKMQFWRCIRYGGDRAALLPHTDKSGKAPRPAQEGRPRVGAKPERIGLNAPPLREGMTAVQRSRVVDLVNVYIREAWSDAKGAVDRNVLLQVLRKRKSFFERFRSLYYLESDSEAVRNSRPRQHMVIDCLRIVERTILAELIDTAEATIRAERGWSATNAARKTPLPGNEADRGLRIVETLQMDGKVFRNIEIVLVSEITGRITTVGKARAIFVRGSDPDIIVGWHGTGLPESATGYSFALYCALSDKVEHLRRLGLDIANYPGLVEGFGHECVIDYGAGRSKRFALWGPETVGVDIGFTLPGAPVNKGGVEGVNRRAEEGILEQLGFVSSLVSEELSWLETLPAGYYSVEKLKEARKNQVREKRGENIICMKVETFDWLLVEFANSYNLRRLTRPTAASKEATEARVPLIPAELYKFKRMQRELMGEVFPSNKDLAYTWLPLRRCDLDKKSITVSFQGRSYGARAGYVYPGAVKLKLHAERARLAGRKGGVTIEFVELPDAEGAAWRFEEEATGIVEWVELKPTSATRNSVGDETDHDTKQALRRLRLEGVEDGEVADYRARNAAASRQAHLENKTFNAHKPWLADSTERAGVRAQLKKEEARAHFNMLARAANLPLGKFDDVDAAEVNAVFLKRKIYSLPILVGSKPEADVEQPIGPKPPDTDP